MSDASTPPHVPSTRAPDLDELTRDLKRVLTSGLPITPALEIPALLGLRGVWARAVDPSNPLARVDAADRLVRAQLKKVALQRIRQPEQMPQAAQRLFGTAGSRGKDITDRRIDAARVLGYDVDHFRVRIVPKIVAQLAWQLYQDSLQYVPRGKNPPAEASGDTPVISEEDIANPERAQHEILLSRIWSEVYGLRAELIEREAHRGAAEDARFKEAAEAAELHLGTLLNYLDDYLTRYGDKILHGEAEFKAEALIRLAGWRGELTEKQARELRWKACRRQAQDDEYGRQSVLGEA